MKAKVELKHVVTNKVNKIVTSVTASLYIDNLCICDVTINDDLSLQLSPFSRPAKEKRFNEAQIDSNWIINELIVHFN